MAKLSKQCQFDLLYLPYTEFEVNTYKYIPTAPYVSTTYKVIKPILTKAMGEAAFVLQTIYNKCVAFRYPNVFQCGGESEHRSGVTKLLKQHNPDA